jgi:putative addiction module component (TIGR02574 family)
MTLSDLPQVAALSNAEKLQLIGELRDDAASNPEDVPVPEWLKEELDRRLAKFDADPESGLTLDEVSANVRKAIADVRSH